MRQNQPASPFCGRVQVTEIFSGGVFAEEFRLQKYSAEVCASSALDI